MNKNITIAGTGYVGMSLAVLLSLKNKVIATDIMDTRVEMINNKISTIKDSLIERYLKEEKLNFSATSDVRIAYKDADYVFIAVPTNYDEKTQYFDTHCIDDVLATAMKYNKKCTFIIKSTIPIGYTENLRKKYGTNRIIFSPEFLREGNALYDNLHPSRIIVGTDYNDKETLKSSKEVLKLLKESSDCKTKNTMLMGITEAESVKLFSNTYLAMRVSFFNELDTYAEINGLKSIDIINGMSKDKRIGDGYNNPSFGYGGYCLPKDTKQMVANFMDIPESMMTAIVNSNMIRKSHIAREIRKKIANINEPVIGIYKLAMKSGSDNYRSSAIIDIIDMLKNYYKDKCEIIIFDETISKFEGCTVSHNLETFKEQCNVVVTNRFDENLDTIKEKVYTRDCFGNN